MQHESRLPVRDDDYYFRQAIFLVEDRLFKVPVSHFAKESDVFRTMFELPPDPSMKVDGMTDEQPIVLEGVKKEDFKQLLRLLYSRRYSDEEVLTTEQWVSVLRLSSKWDMEKFRSLAIKNITPVLNTNPHEMVLWGKKFNVDEWQFVGIQRLVGRENPMDEEDVRALGLSTVLQISALRELWLHRTILRAGCSRVKVIVKEVIDQEICSVFYLNQLQAEAKE